MPISSKLDFCQLENLLGGGHLPSPCANRVKVNEISKFFSIHFMHWKAKKSPRLGGPFLRVEVDLFGKKARVLRPQYLAIP